MSNLSQDYDIKSFNEPFRGVKLIITPTQKDLGGFSVRRALPVAEQRGVGPWIFFDHAGPAVFPPGEGIDVKPHPYINLATVSYLFDGAVMHRDSLGNELAIVPGDINLMVAGKGIVHSERTPDSVRAAGHTLHLLQLWLALPEPEEETAPAFYHYDAIELSTTELNGIAIRVMMGQAYGLKSPVKTFAQTPYFEADIGAGKSLEIPGEEERAIYVAGGKVEINGREVEAFSMAVLETDCVITVKASKDSRIALIGGETLTERHLFWNFVFSRKERLEQAKQDWKNGRFPKVAGDEEEFIPLPE
jgi:redox-sensitive bicupin YhaK (pirin superfamily)